MKIELDLKRPLQQNISRYFDESKKSKAKLDRLGKAILDMKQRIQRLDEKKPAKSSKVLHAKRSKQWFEKFHWFYTSSNLLCIAGRDAVSNDQLVKKQLDSNDYYFHADIQGAAHTILKGGKSTSSTREVLIESAQFAALWSKAWNQQLGIVDVYMVSAEQVSKTAPSGESVGTGAFIISGERNWFKKTPLRCAIGVQPISGAHQVISGPKSAISTKSVWFVELVPGKIGKNALAKQLSALFSKKFPEARIPLDEWISMMPNGESEIVSSKA